MDFSIVIPIYNSSRYLPKTLKRIFNACQGFDYQVILVDDCSDEDDIKSIRQIAATNSNVMLHEKKQKSNAAVSRNLGTKLAQSEIVFFLDSDDYFTTNYIIRRMKKHEDRHIDIIFGNYAEVSGDSVRDFNFHYKSGSSGEDFLFWKWAIFGHPPSACVKKRSPLFISRVSQQTSGLGFSGQRHQFGRASGA